MKRAVWARCGINEMWRQVDVDAEWLRGVTLAARINHAESSGVFQYVNPADGKKATYFDPSQIVCVVPQFVIGNRCYNQVMIDDPCDWYDREIEKGP